MRDLGVLLLLYGIAACFMKFLGWGEDAVFFNWMDKWGEGPSWAIRGAFILVGFVVTKLGKKPAPRPQS